MTEKEKLEEVLRHLKNIRSKVSILDSNLTSLKSSLDNNVILNSEGYKVKEVEKIRTDINSMSSTFINSTIPSIKRRIDSLDS